MELLKSIFPFELLANIASVVSGISNGWSSAATILLTSDETPLPSGKISMDDASWIASLYYVGGNHDS